jgi:hypothetical protein
MRLNKFVWIPAILVAANSTLVVFMQIVIPTSSDTEAGMGWSCCFLFDPAALLFLDPHSFYDPFMLLLVGGGLQWLFIGFAFALICHWLKKISS